MCMWFGYNPQVNFCRFFHILNLGGGKAAYGFGADWIKTLVSMATESPLWLIMEKWCLHLFLVAFDQILFILSGNEDMHKILDEFEFRSNLTTDYGVSCPWASKNISHRLMMGKWCLHASSFIFDWIIIKVVGNQDRHKSSVKFDLGQIRPLILELLALEWQKFHTFELEYLWRQLANLDHILCVASLGWGIGCIRIWGRLDPNSGFHCNRKPPLTYNGENDVSTSSRLFLFRSFLFL